MAFFSVSCGGKLRSVCGDCYITRQHTCSDLRCLRFLGDLYHSKHTQGQVIEAWRHSFSHKLGGNVLSPVIATSPDRTIVLAFDVLSVSPMTRKRRTKTGSGAVVAFFFQAEDGIRDCLLSRGLGDVYKRQGMDGECSVGSFTYRLGD